MIKHDVSTPPSPQWYISTPVPLLRFARVTLYSFIWVISLGTLSHKQDLNTTICQRRLFRLPF